MINRLREKKLSIIEVHKTTFKTLMENLQWFLLLLIISILGGALTFGITYIVSSFTWIPIFTPMLVLIITLLTLILNISIKISTSYVTMKSLSEQEINKENIISFVKGKFYKVIFVDLAVAFIQGLMASFVVGSYFAVGIFILNNFKNSVLLSIVFFLYAILGIVIVALFVNIMSKYIFASYIVIFKKVGIFKAIKESRKMVNERKKEVLKHFLVMVITLFIITAPASLSGVWGFSFLIGIIQFAAMRIYIMYTEIYFLVLFLNHQLIEDAMEEEQNIQHTYEKDIEEEIEAFEEGYDTSMYGDFFAGGSLENDTIENSDEDDLDY